VFVVLVGGLFGGGGGGGVRGGVLFAGGGVVGGVLYGLLSVCGLFLEVLGCSLSFSFPDVAAGA